MKYKYAIIILIMLCFPVSAAALNPVATEQTNEVVSFIDGMIKTHESAFISSCIVHSGSTRSIARIIFFPMKNKGIFTLTGNHHIVSNWGNVSWTNKGQWDLANLEGGLATIKIMSNLYYQVTRLPFMWYASGNIRHALSAKPKYFCHLLGSSGYDNKDVSPLTGY